MSRFSKEWIENIPKTINANGCWIPKYKPDINGYVRIKVRNEKFLLHRMVMCLWYNIDYDNKKIETRHAKGCDRRCFWHAHLKPGTQIENKLDKIEHHKDELCKKCGSTYYYRRTIKDCIPRMERRCRTCHIRNQRIRREAYKLG